MFWVTLEEKLRRLSSSAAIVTAVCWFWGLTEASSLDNKQCFLVENNHNICIPIPLMRVDLVKT